MKKNNLCAKLMLGMGLLAAITQCGYAANISVIPMGTKQFTCPAGQVVTGITARVVRICSGTACIDTKQYMLESVQCSLPQ